MSRFVDLSMHHPQDRGASYARLTTSRELRSGKLDEARLTERDLIRIIEQAAACLRTMGKPR